MISSKLPYDPIIGCLKSNQHHMRAVWRKITKTLNQSRRDIMVK